MTSPKASRTARAARYLAPEPLPGVTLASVLVAIDTADLPARRKQDMASAVRTVARVLGTSPEQLPALPRLLTRKLAKVAPLTHSIEAKRWNNIRSLLRASLNLMAPVAPGRHLNGMTPPWQSLWDYMRAKGHTDLKIGLSRFMRFCSAEGIAPHEVTAEVYHRFAASLDNSLLKSPDSTRRSTRWAWAKARKTVPGWPDIDLPKPPPRKGRYSLPLSVFPESFQQDLTAWLNHLAGIDYLDGATHDPLRPESLDNRKRHILGFASALVRQERDPASICSLADLLELDALKLGLRFYIARNTERTGRQTSRSLEQCVEALITVARHWVKVSPEHLKAIKDTTARLRIDKGGLSERNLDRLRQFDDPANVEALLDLPQLLFAKAESMTHGQRAAVLVQTAIAIALLIVAPMRMRNLTMIDIGKHIQRPGRSRNVMLLVFREGEVKNRQWLDYPIPEDAIVWLQRYLDEYRPLLAPEGSTALFPARDGNPKSRKVLGPRISRTIFQYTGLHMHPHLFRHFAAKLHLEAEPGSYEGVRRLLGHKSLRTTTGFYTGLEQSASARHYDKLRSDLRARRRKL